MTYKQALEYARKAGAANATGLPLLAQTVHILSVCHAINPELAYNGAVKRGLSAKQVRQLEPVELGDLMFVDE